MEKLFEVATRKKVRFEYRGLLSVEDLWDLPVTALDNIFKKLNRQVKDIEEESLLTVKNEDVELKVKVELLKYIVSIKLEEAEKVKRLREVREQKQKILSIMAEKKDEAIKGKSLEELSKMLDELEGKV